MDHAEIVCVVSGFVVLVALACHRAALSSARRKDLVRISERDRLRRAGA